MGNRELRIVYMGTPGFAVEPLKRLIRDGFHVVGVVTAPDRPAGRGKKLRQSEVKQFILSGHPEIPVLQPEKLKSPEFLEELRALEADLQVVVAFRMLPEAVWKMPARGTFNLHASLLPQYRGAAPINHVLINGEKQSGVTTFFIDDKIDTGGIIAREKLDIGEEETAGELHDRLMVLGAGLVSKTVEMIATGQFETEDQEDLIASPDELRPAPKIFKEDCRIDWTTSGGGRRITDLIRGLSPYPAAFTTLNREGGEKLLCKIFRASFEALPHREKAGHIHSDGKQELEVYVPDGIVHIRSLQVEGKKRMDTRDFLAGFRIGEACWFS